jgi:hypothetical protein
MQDGGSTTVSVVYFEERRFKFHRFQLEDPNTVNTKLQIASNDKSLLRSRRDHLPLPRTAHTCSRAASLP